MSQIRILIADDHWLFREGLRRILADFADLIVVGDAANAADAISLAVRLRPDVVLMDVNMPGMSGPEATRRLREAVPETRVLMLTVSDRDEDLFAAVKAGARGFLLKNMDGADLVAAIRHVHAGEAVVAPSMATKLLDEFNVLASRGGRASDSLTERELAVLRAVAGGMSNKEIAAVLTLSEHTVKTHLRHILEKLHLRSRAHAAAYAVEAGLTDPERSSE